MSELIRWRESLPRRDHLAPSLAPGILDTASYLPTRVPFCWIVSRDTIRKDLICVLAGGFARGGETQTQSSFSEHMGMGVDKLTALPPLSPF